MFLSVMHEIIAISRFKATCLEVLERVRVTGKPVLVTRFGQPVAEVIPPGPGTKPGSWLGAMRGRGEVRGDPARDRLDGRDLP